MIASNQTSKSYVLVSACRNEADFIDDLARCIASQSMRPAKWVIVDDGSTDETYQRAMKWCETLPWLQIIRMPSGRPRNFASQVYAAQQGFQQMKSLDFEYVGFLDADIRIGPNYYERLIQFFDADPKLGLAAGVLIDQYPDRLENVRAGSEDYHVPGGVQFFRRKCFEQIGGYLPIDGGGQDTVADVMALMHGWRIQSFHEIKGLHLRPDGVGHEGIFRRGMKWGRKFYLIGYHPMYYVGQCLRRLGRHPAILGSICQLLGFGYCCLRRERRPVDAEFVKFLRQTQIKRLRAMLYERVRTPMQQWSSSK